MLACIAADLKKQGFISLDGEVDRAIQTLRKGPKGVTPFHWELEFPEVFTSDEDGSYGRFRCDHRESAFRGRQKDIEHWKGLCEWLTIAHQQSQQQCRSSRVTFSGGPLTSFEKAELSD